MNENLPLRTLTLDAWLRTATETLKDISDSARLDAELILSHTLRKPRTYLHAHSDALLSERHEDIANARLQLRIDRTPIAYIIGHKEFYGRRFITTPAALIPRPESETIIHLLNAVLRSQHSSVHPPATLVDVGTGTGCLGITAKLEFPELDVTLTDIDRHALNLAQKNAETLHADVHYLKTNLLHGYIGSIDILVANLPYVDRSWDVSPETYAEPEQALYADNNGLALIKTLIIQANLFMNTGSHMLLESDMRQHNDIIAHAEENGFRHIETDGLITHFSKI